MQPNLILSYIQVTPVGFTDVNESRIWLVVYYTAVVQVTMTKKRALNSISN